MSEALTLTGTDDNGTLAKVKKYFTEAQDLTQQSRVESLIDIDYYDSKQWTSAEKLALANRGQPDLVINRTKPAVNGILGVVERGKSEPRAFPRTPGDDDASDVATDTLRYIADFNRFSTIKVRCFKDMLVPGSMAAQVIVDDDMQVVFEQIRWEEFFYDPRSRREDFQDARYLGIAKWIYADDLAAMYPDQSDGIESAVSTGQLAPDLNFQDRPQSAPMVWIDRRQRRLLVVEVYYREARGGWKRCVYYNQAILEEGDSPYQDDKGRPTCPIVAASSYVDRENQRYGAVRDMRGPQDEINKRRSKALHYLNTRQVQEAAPGQGMGEVDTVRSEAAKPDGVLPSGWTVIPQTDQVQGQLQLLQEAKGEIERLGPNPAVIGREGASASGRALQSRQEAGLIELGILFGTLDDWELRMYRQAWSRAKQFWTQPQWIRVTDEEDAPKFVGLNQPEQDPMTGQVLGYSNQVAEMDIDITLETVNDTANIQAEMLQDLIQLVASNPNYAQQVPFEMMLELSPVPHKRQLMDKLKQFREQAQQGQAQQAQQQQQIAEAGAKSEINKNDASAEYDRAKANTEMMKPHLEVLKLQAQAAQSFQGGPPVQDGGGMPAA